MRMNKRVCTLLKRGSCVGPTVLSVALGMSVAHAQAPPADTSDTATGDSLQEVVVTAERRTQDIQKTAVSVTALNGADLQQQGRYTIEQMLQDVPSVTTYATTPNGGQVDTPNVVPSDNPAASIVIRGVPTAPQPVIGTGASSVAYYADGIYGGMSGDMDVNRIEVLRGPQGTLYGRSATSGVVAVYTKDPVLGKFTGDGLGEIGSYQLHHVEGGVNIPLGDTFALRVSANQLDQQGQISGQGSEGKEQEARIKLLFQPNSDLRVLVGYANRADYDNSGGAIVQNVPNVPNSSEVVGGLPIYPNFTDQHQTWAQLDWNVGIGDLTYIPAYHTYDTRGSIVAFNGHIQQQQSIPTDRFLTHELRLASHDDSAVKWVVGGTYFDNAQEIHFNPVWRVSRALVSNQITDINARDVGAFAEATIPFADSWRFTAGLRYDSTRIQETESVTQNFAAGNTAPNFDSPTNGLPENLGFATLGGQAGILSYSNVTYKARIEKDLTDQNLLYGMVATGFLPGSESLTTVKSGTTESIVLNTLSQEKLTSFELGSKNRFLNNRLQINGDVFYYTYQGYQEVVNVNPLIPGDFATISSPARMVGLELEAVYLLTSDDRVNASFGHTRAYFVDETPTFASFLAQKTIPSVVPTTAVLSYDHTFHLPGGSSLDLYDQLRFSSGYDEGSLTAAQLPAEPFIHIGNQWLDDANLGWTSASARYGATFYVHNLTNQHYPLNETIVSYVAATPTTPQQTTIGFLPILPRTYGLVVHASF